MRDKLKFRAWDKAEKRMLSFDEITNPAFNLDVNRPLLFYVLKSHDVHEIMPYIGLNDANGKHIYEVDIFKYTETGHTIVIKWQEGQCCNFACSGYELTKELAKQGVVIGNCFENPELIPA